MGSGFRLDGQAGSEVETVLAALRQLAPSLLAHLTTEDNHTGLCGPVRVTT